MALEYFPFYHSYGKKTEKLTDQELGRLVRALVKFSETGELQELAGRESIAFDFIAVDIQNAKNAYEDKCSKNRANGATAAERNRTVPDGTERTQNKTKTKEETKTETNALPPVAPPPEQPAPKPKTATKLAEEIMVLWVDPLRDAVFEWLAYKKEKGQNYKETGLRALLTQIQKAADQYGYQAVVDVIHTSMSANYAGIVFDRLGERRSAAKTGTAAELEESYRMIEAWANGKT